MPEQKMSMEEKLAKARAARQAKKEQRLREQEAMPATGSEPKAPPSKYPTPRKSIRLHCLECCGGESPKEVELCQCPECKLWPWRFGIRPEIAERDGKVTDPDKFVDRYAHSARKT